MQRCLAVFVLIVFAISMVSAQNPTAAPQNGAAPQAGDKETAILVELTKTLDAKKLKAGDPVNARLTQALEASDGSVAPPGSMVKGHIVAATARGKGDPLSSMTIAFDAIVFRNGQQRPLQASIQAVGAPPMISPEEYGGAGAPPTMNSPGTPNPPGTMSPSGPLGGGAPVGGMPLPAGNSPQTAGRQGNNSSLGTLTTQSTGVVGLRNMELQPNSTLTSTGKDLKLDSGTEMVLRVQDR